MGNSLFPLPPSLFPSGHFHQLKWGWELKIEIGVGVGMGIGNSQHFERLLVVLPTNEQPRITVMILFHRLLVLSRRNEQPHVSRAT